MIHSCFVILHLLDSSLCCHFNPLVQEFKIPVEPINAGDKMAAPRREPISLRITLYSPFLQPALVMIFSGMTVIQEDSW